MSTTAQNPTKPRNGLDLSGKHAFITGGGGGLGRQMTQALAEAGARVTICGRTEQKLIGADVLDGGALPIWIPPGGEDFGAVLVSPARAVSHGLRFRPLEQTVRDTLEWQKQRPAAQQTLKVGLSAQREAELLKLLRAS